MNCYFAGRGNSSTINGVTTMIRTRYGYLSPVLLVAVELCVTGTVMESVATLDGAYRTLDTHLRDPRSDGGSVMWESSPSRPGFVQSVVGAGKSYADKPYPETVADRWDAVRSELFEISEVEITPVPDPAVVAMMVEDADARRVTDAIFAAVGMFLISEANALEERIPFDDDETFEDVEAAVARVLWRATTLRRHVMDRTWPQLYSADPHAALPTSPITETEADSPHELEESDTEPGASPSTVRHHPPIVDRPVDDAHRRAEPDPFGRLHRDQVLRVFRRASCNVPAYRDFLSLHGLTTDRVRTLDDFTKVPPTTHEDLVSWGCVGRTLWSASAGSHGPPLYWPREETAVAADIDYHDRVLGLWHSQSQRRRSLVLADFAIGGWLGSTCTTQTLRGLERRGHKLSVVAPGCDPGAVAREISARGRDFDQIVLTGYPPFVQEVLERAGRATFDLDLQILLAGENITETWRDRITALVESRGGRANPILLYGTEDTGILGHETPSTIAIRRLARDNLVLAEALFGGHPTALPTLVEYDPQRIYAELDTDRLLITTDSPVPLIRYRINDPARILNADQLTATLHDHGYEVPVRTTTPGAGFLVIDSKNATENVVAPAGPKTARIRLVGKDADAELNDLMSWLRHEDGLRGRVQIEKRTDRMSTASQVVAVVLATSLTGVAGTTAAVLATALSLWLDSRRPRVTVEITRTDGRSATISEGEIPAVEETRQLLLEPASS